MCLQPFQCYLRPPSSLQMPYYVPCLTIVESMLDSMVAYCNKPKIVINLLSHLNLQQQYPHGTLSHLIRHMYKLQSFDE